MRAAASIAAILVTASASAVDVNPIWRYYTPAPDGHALWYDLDASLPVTGAGLSAHVFNAMVGVMEGIGERVEVPDPSGYSTVSERWNDAIPHLPGASVRLDMCRNHVDLIGERDGRMPLPRWSDVSACRNAFGAWLTDRTVLTHGGVTVYPLCTPDSFKRPYNLPVETGRWIDEDDARSGRWITDFCHDHGSIDFSSVFHGVGKPVGVSNLCAPSISALASGIGWSISAAEAPAPAASGFVTHAPAEAWSSRSLSADPMWSAAECLSKFSRSHFTVSDHALGRPYRVTRRTRVWTCEIDTDLISEKVRKELQDARDENRAPSSHLNISGFVRTSVTNMVETEDTTSISAGSENSAYTYDGIRITSHGETYIYDPFAGSVDELKTSASYEGAHEYVDIRGERHPGTLWSQPLPTGVDGEIQVEAPTFEHRSVAWTTSPGQTPYISWPYASGLDFVMTVVAWCDVSWSTEGGSGSSSMVVQDTNEGGSLETEIYYMFLPNILDGMCQKAGLENATGVPDEDDPSVPDSIEVDLSDLRNNSSGMYYWISEDETEYVFLGTRNEDGSFSGGSASVVVGGDATYRTTWKIKGTMYGNSESLEGHASFSGWVDWNFGAVRP